MSEFSAHLKRWSRGWEIHIPGVGVTQSNTNDTDECTAMAEDYIALVTGEARKNIRVTIREGETE